MKIPLWELFRVKLIFYSVFNRKVDFRGAHQIYVLYTIEPAGIYGALSGFIMGTVKKDDRDFRRIAFALFAAGFVTFITLYDVQPLLPIFSREFDVSAAAGSLSLSAATITMGVMMLLAGTLSETWGRKRIMTWAMAITSVCALATAFTGDFISLVALRLIQGIALAGVPAVAMAYLSEEMDTESLAAAMGLYIAGNAAGGMTGRSPGNNGRQPLMAPGPGDHGNPLRRRHRIFRQVAPCVEKFHAPSLPGTISLHVPHAEPAHTQPEISLCYRIHAHGLLCVSLYNFSPFIFGRALQTESHAGELDIPLLHFRFMSSNPLRVTCEEIRRQNSEIDTVFALCGVL
jgi:hypothetical protein